MTPLPPAEVLIKSTIDALNIERARVLAGDFNDLPKLTERKLHYLSLLQTYMNDPASGPSLKPFVGDIEFIKKLAQENEKLIASARAGLTAAKNRLNNLKNREQRVGTYTEDGAKLGAHDANVTRRIIA